ncbi:MAG: hypothetical protein WDA16_05280 [Candidatus Thermoplasmatota archaeon]
MLDPRTRFALVLAALTLSANVAAVVAPGGSLTGRGPTDDAPSAVCASLAQEPHTAFVPGLLHEGRSTYAHEQRNVTADRSTIVSGLALAQAQGERPDALSLMSWTFERDEVCTFDLRRVVTITGAMDALALGIHEPILPPNATIVVAFHTSAFRNVTLDEANAMAALALLHAGGRVNISDVANIEEGNRTMRTFTRIVDSNEEQAAISLALMSLKEDAVEAPTPLPRSSP